MTFPDYVSPRLQWLFDNRRSLEEVLRGEVDVTQVTRSMVNEEARDAKRLQNPSTGRPASKPEPGSHPVPLHHQALSQSPEGSA